jgi:hypothetical protein
MRKRTSKRRWKARCRLGKPIPALVMVDFELAIWFKFVPVPGNRDLWVAL